MSSQYNNKVLYLIRGLPGAGKTTLAKTLNVDLVAEVDSYFYCRKEEDGSVTRHVTPGDEDVEYIFELDKLEAARADCYYYVEDQISWGVSRIAIVDVFATEDEFKQYFDLANRKNYVIFSIIVENRFKNKSIHPVPKEDIEEMHNNFNITL